MKMGLPLMNFMKIIASRPKNSLFFTLPLKKSSIFIVGTDVKMQLAQSLQLNPPVKSLNLAKLDMFF